MNGLWIELTVESAEGKELGARLALKAGNPAEARRLLRDAEVAYLSVVKLDPSCTPALARVRSKLKELDR